MPALAPVEALLASLQGHEIQAFNFETFYIEADFLLKQLLYIEADFSLNHNALVYWIKLLPCRAPNLVIQQSHVIPPFLQGPIS